MAADALEQHLSAIESKVEELLAGAGAGALEPENAQENSTKDQNQLQNGEAEKK